MLDLDDTVLKEVSIEHKNNPKVQSVIYSPGESFKMKYKNRILHPEKDRVIHYEFINDSNMKSYLTVRPTIIDLLNELDPFMIRKRWKQYIKTSNLEI